MNKLSEAIEQAKQECIETGTGEIKLNNNITIYTEWARYDDDIEVFDTILISVFENNKHKFNYFLNDEIKVLI